LPIGDALQGAILIAYRRFRRHFHWVLGAAEVFSKASAVRPPDSNQHLNDTLAKLTREFTASVPARLDAIRIAFKNTEDNDWSATSVADLHRHVHSLAGAAGTFGEMDLSAGAKKSWMQ
jgi:HPt (histidine-containing phosphotransfer) domain-containing protein